MCYNLGDAEKKNKKKGPDFTQIQAKKKSQGPRIERVNPYTSFALPGDQYDQLQFPRSLMGEHNFPRGKSEQLRR
jgi:hypothetical protein